MTTLSPRVRAAAPGDCAQLADIYNHYILGSIATFEEVPVEPSTFTERLRASESAELPWLIADEGDALLGYAYASKWQGRCAYRYSVETTVYVAAACRSRGIGSLLYEALLAKLAASGLHAAIAGISLPNEASIRLHERFGFEKVAHFREVGFKYGNWIDVGYWERLL